MRRVDLVASMAAALLLAAACGGGDGDDGGSAGTGGDAADSGAVSNLDDVASATVQIVATGSFVDPEVGLQADVAGAGSGFLIDSSGIAVTNNHVVTGAATLDVFVGGEEDPRNAVVLAVSECSDLAVIDIEGENFPYLDWYDGEISTNLDVRSAGYPLGDPEFTLTRGIVSKAVADGETNWASVDAVVEHDARINPGNSGGPLVDENARVVGVNYAGSSETDQNFAIAASRAQDIVEQLRKGEDVQGIGINGVAVLDEEAGISGVWVSSVKSGSPADTTGIRAGDILTRMENLTLAAEGTMKEYCDVLQSRTAGDVIGIEVLRFETEEVLEGQLNGRELEPSFSFAQELDDEVAAGEPGSSYAAYETITDDSGAIEVEVPTAWTDIDGSAREFGPTVVASTNIDGLLGGWEDPGVLFTASTQVDGSNPDPVLDELLQAECTSQGRQDYDDGLYRGKYELTTNCAGTDTGYLVLVAAPDDNAFATIVAMQLVSDADLEALDRVLESFRVVGDI